MVEKRGFSPGDAPRHALKRATSLRRANSRKKLRFFAPETGLFRPVFQRVGVYLHASRTLKAALRGLDLTLCRIVVTRSSWSKKWRFRVLLFRKPVEPKAIWIWFVESLTN